MTDGLHAIGDARIYARSDGIGVPVVLLHGFGLDHRMWDDQVPALADRFRVIRYDMRGYGRSSLPTEAAYAHADDLDELLGALNARPAHIVGLSLGGRVAVQFALRHPDSVRSLTLIDSALDGHVWSDDWRQRWSETIAIAKSGDVNKAKRLWFDHPLFAPAREQPRVAARLSAMLADYSGWHWANTDPGLAPKPAALSRLADIRAPSMVVVGERDLPDFHRIADALGAGIGGASRIEVARAGHMSTMEAPAFFNDLLLDFLVRPR
jgi:3-oxoadipate enol-lactonase